MRGSARSQEKIWRGSKLMARHVDARQSQSQGELLLSAVSRLESAGAKLRRPSNLSSFLLRMLRAPNTLTEL
jgi:hypothetical protein